MHHDEQDIRWFETFRASEEFARLQRRPIAYFCAEFGLAEHVPTYSGGLGILAGDVIREAADRGMPFVGVGLYYHEGYACDLTDESGKPVGVCFRHDPVKMGLEPVLDAQGKRLLLKIPVAMASVTVQVWQWKQKDVSVYLLDTDIEPNSPADRRITDRLYVGDKETRFKQQLILGVGGLRLVETLGMHPSVWHLNEGHSALLALELIRHQMEERGIGFAEAKQFARRRVVMTNHTLVAAGNETYSNDLVAMLLAGYAEELQVPVNELVKFGLVQESSTFSMTMLALRMAGVVNAVSKLHAEKAKEIWGDHPMVAVTNGVHVPTWDRIATDVDAPGAFWAAHQVRKAELLAHIEKTTGKAWGKDELLIGWARRFVQYKRPLALLEDMAALVEIARNADRPVRFVFAGIPHPDDENGVALLATLMEHVGGDLADCVAYLPDYDIALGQMLTSGCDVWLNTPVVGFEACGTSGMKAALNGVLPASTNDGWVYEAELYKVGWILDSVRVSAEALRTIREDIAPMYYDRGTDGVPALWEEHMRNARAMAMSQFSATRMLRDYIEMLYV